MKMNDVLIGEDFEWKGRLFRLKFKNQNTVQANPFCRVNFGSTYKVIMNDDDVILKRSAMGREHLVNVKSDITDASA